MAERGSEVGRWMDGCREIDGRWVVRWKMMDRQITEMWVADG